MIKKKRKKNSVKKNMIIFYFMVNFNYYKLFIINK